MVVSRFEDDHVGMESKKVSPVINGIGLEVRPEFNVVLAAMTSEGYITSGQAAAAAAAPVISTPLPAGC